jgi:hypothetical protein
MLLEALTLRSEWRDADALGFLRLARSVWPAMPAVDGLIAATETRLRMFEPGSDAKASRIRLRHQPRLLPWSNRGLAAAGEPFAAADGSRPQQAPEFASDNATSVTARGVGATSTDAVARGLAQVESRLARSDLQGAVAELFELARRFRPTPAVQVRLARFASPARTCSCMARGPSVAQSPIGSNCSRCVPRIRWLQRLLRAARAELNSEAGP